MIWLVIQFIFKDLKKLGGTQEIFRSLKEYFLTPYLLGLTNMTKYFSLVGIEAKICKTSKCPNYKWDNLLKIVMWFFLGEDFQN